MYLAAQNLSSLTRDPTWAPAVKALGPNHWTARVPTNVFLSNPKWGFPDSSVGKESACNAGDPGLTPGLGRFPGEGNGNPFQYSCLENSRDRGAWWATAHGITKSQTQLSD